MIQPFKGRICHGESGFSVISMLFSICLASMDGNMLTFSLVLITLA